VTLDALQQISSAISLNALASYDSNGSFRVGFTHLLQCQQHQAHIHTPTAAPL
jgi:hypothetical protein